MRSNYYLFLLIIGFISTNCSNKNSIHKFCTEFVLYSSHHVQTESSDELESEYSYLMPIKIKIYQDESTGLIEGYSVHNIISANECSNIDNLNVSQLIHEVEDAHLKEDTLWIYFKDGMKHPTFLTQINSSLVFGVSRSSYPYNHSERKNPSFLKKTDEYNIFNTEVSKEALNKYYMKQILDKKRKILDLESLKENSFNKTVKSELDKKIIVLNNSIKKIELEMNSVEAGFYN